MLWFLQMFLLIVAVPVCSSVLLLSSAVDAGCLWWSGGWWVVGGLHMYVRIGPHVLRVCVHEYQSVLFCLSACLVGVVVFISGASFLRRSRRPPSIRRLGIY